MKREGIFGEKRGQFYLIAAFVLAAIIIGIAVISNYSKSTSNERIYDIKDEIQIESAKVLDYGTANELNQDSMNQLVTDFVNDYLSYRKDGNFYFIFGIRNNVTVMVWQENAESASVVTGTQETNLEITPKEIFSQSFVPVNNKIKLNVMDSSHEFNLSQGENFFFVLSQNSGSGGYIVNG